MTDHSNRCPVVRRFLMELEHRISASSSTLYAEELTELGELYKGCEDAGRSHSVQLLRCFYLLEAVLYQVHKLSRLYPGYGWEPLMEYPQALKPSRSREGLQSLLTTLQEQQDSLQISYAEAVLSSDLRVYNRVPSYTSIAAVHLEALKGFLLSAQSIALFVKSSLVESVGSMGPVASCAHTAFDHANTNLQVRLQYAHVLLQITEGNPVSP
jgi:hypothetical protein